MRNLDSKQHRRRALRRLGRRIAQLRSIKGWNQKELAKRIGRGINSVSRWENGTQEMGVVDACLLADELGATLADLLLDPVSGVSAEPPPTPLRTALLDEGLDLLDRSRRLLHKEGIELLEEARKVLQRLRP